MQQSAKEQALALLERGPYCPPADVQPELAFALDMLVADGEARWSEIEGGYVKRCRG